MYETLCSIAVFTEIPKSITVEVLKSVTKRHSVSELKIDHKRNLLSHDTFELTKYFLAFDAFYLDLNIVIAIHGWCMHDRITDNPRENLVLINGIFLDHLALVILDKD